MFRIRNGKEWNLFVLGNFKGNGTFLVYVYIEMMVCKEDNVDNNGWYRNDILIID